MNKIAIIGLGYVGLSNALFLAKNNKVHAYDIVSEKIEILKNGKSPIKEDKIEEFLKNTELDIQFSNDFNKTIDKADLILIATPTDYDVDKNYFNTSSIEDVIEKILPINKKAIILIKSTIPVGYTKQICKKYNTQNIIFSPEFLRESKSLDDVLNPTRIIIGEKSDRAQKIAELFQVDRQPILLMNSTEAEAVKLFANTYLATRVAFFNELDTYADVNKLNAKDIIDGVSLDSRIGNFYNNPSFGYGGYCLPKDTKQLLANYNDIPNNLIKATVKSNETRKDFIVSQILARKVNVVGIYRLTMKSGSDNFRSSSIIDIMNKLKKAGIKIFIYEPTVDKYEDFEIENDLDKFKEYADLIIANRVTIEIKDVKEKVYTRDIYQEN